MKPVELKPMRWVMTALIASTALMVGTLPNVVEAKPAKEKPAKEKVAKAIKARSKTATGTVSQASATQIKLTTKEGDLTANLVPTTEYYRVQEGLAAADLKVGDTVKFTLKGTDGLPAVQSLAPLTLKYGDAATLTINKTEKMKFDRVTKIAAAEVTTGQTAKVASNVFPDGKMEAREVWVEIAAAKPEKKP